MLHYEYRKQQGIVIGDDAYNPLAMEEYILRQVKDDHNWSHTIVEGFSVDAYKNAFSNMLLDPGPHILMFNEGTSYYDEGMDEYVETYDEVNVENFEVLTEEVDLVAFGRYAHPELNKEMDEAELAAYRENEIAIRQKASLPENDIMRVCVAEFCQRSGLPPQPEWAAEQASMNYLPIERKLFSTITDEEKIYRVERLLDNEHFYKNYPDESCVRRVENLMKEVPLETIKENMEIEAFWRAVGKAVVRARHDSKDTADASKVEQAQSYVAHIKECIDTHPEGDFIKQYVNQGIEQVRLDRQKRQENQLQNDSRTR